MSLIRGYKDNDCYLNVACHGWGECPRVLIMRWELVFRGKLLELIRGVILFYDSMGWYENLQRYLYKALGTSLPSSFSSFYAIVRSMFHVEH
jgi:hypothetical protein